MNLEAPMTLLALAEALTRLYDEEPTGEMGRELERALAERVCQECGRPITRHVYPSEVARGEGRYCSQSCWGKVAGRAGGKAGRGESKSRSVELRAYHRARREGRWLA